MDSINSTLHFDISFKLCTIKVLCDLRCIRSNSLLFFLISVVIWKLNIYVKIIKLSLFSSLCICCHRLHVCGALSLVAHCEQRAVFLATNSNSGNKLNFMFFYWNQWQPLFTPHSAGRKIKPNFNGKFSGINETIAMNSELFGDHYLYHNK